MFRHTTTHHRFSLVRAFLFALLINLALSTTDVLVPALGHRSVPHAYAATNVAANTADFKPDVIYQVMLDRFFDGNPSNNNPTGDTGLYLKCGVRGPLAASYGDE
jgi:hypothetical protein